MTWLIAEILISLIVVGYLVAESKIVRLGMSIFESSPMFLPQEANPDEDAEIVEILTEDGVRLSGCLYTRSESESRGVIIFCPEFGANKWSWKNYCYGLWESGFDILAIDFRNQGQSERVDSYRELHWATEFEVTDAKAAIRYVKSHPELAERPIGIMGVSRGGATALAVGADHPDVELVVTDSAFPTEPLMMFFVDRWFKVYAPQWMYNLVPRWHTHFNLKLVKKFSQWSRNCEYAEIIPRFKRMADRKKVLLIAGSRDSFVGLKVSQQLERSLGDNCEDLWIVQGAKHNMGNAVAGDEYQTRIESFFSAMSPVHVPPVRVPDEATASSPL